VNSSNIGINNWDRCAKGEGGNCTGGVAADSGQSKKIADRFWNITVVSLDDCSGAFPQAQGSPGITKIRPCP